MILSPTEYYNSQRNPLYKLRLFVNGQEVYSFMTVSGRAHTQTKDRNRSGTEAPLPNGEYRVAKSTTRGTIAEAGDRFLPLTPKFETGRTALGIHYDPSYEKNNGEDGTSGCIGLKNRKELSQLLKYVKMYKLNTLYVEIQSRSGE
ncbi:L,D-transpeptidase [Calothrix sp. 336/3]|uniref:L,D-transpeptidase n=1 Tax=Calothrix sp. 336/3 TaxID=1337936 RepID=UPI001EE01DB6|nr:L,D-transpeptidase [Calothrix sp. 336/3]